MNLIKVALALCRRGAGWEGEGAQWRPRVPLAPVRYDLTEYGRSLVLIVDALRVWGRVHLERRLTEQAVTRS